MKKITILAFALLSAGICQASNPDKVLDNTIKSLWSTSLYNVNAERLGAMNQMQAYIDNCSDKQFSQYLSLSTAAERRTAEEGNVLHFYQAAMDKVVNEIPQTKVEQGTVVIWHLYNMGYVVKTPSHCFAVDIKHPEAERLVPYVEFLLITHFHNDHFTDNFNKALTAAGKKVYTNWDAKDYQTCNLKDQRYLDLGDIKIETNLADHNDKLRDFVICYRVDCGKNTGNVTFYFIGDTCNASQLNPTKPVDILVPHLAVNLDIEAAVNRVRPSTVLVSHIQELGHTVNLWRWSYWLGLETCHNISVIYGDFNAYLPVWGEKFTYTK